MNFTAQLKLYKNIFWKELQGTGISHEVFLVLWDTIIEKIAKTI